MSAESPEQANPGEQAKFPDIRGMLDSAETENKQIRESKDALVVGLSDIAELVPEVGQRYEAINEAGDKLIEQHGIRAELFGDSARCLLFASIANRFAKIDYDQDELAAVKEETFLTNALTILAFQYSDSLLESKLKEDPPAARLTREQSLRIAEKFEDPRLTAEFRRSFESIVLGDLKDELGVDPATEVPYDVKVLSIARGSHTFGLDAVSPEDQDEVDRWVEGLNRREEEHNRYLGVEGSGWAWINWLAPGGKPTIYVSAPVAEKLLDPTLAADNQSYSAQMWRDAEIAMLKHEYVHSQGSLRVGDDVFGYNLEEIRAEAFSGDEGAYFDIKNFFMDYTTITGHDIKREMLGSPLGGTAESVYSSIAKHAGLDMMLEVVSALPVNYIEDKMVNGLVIDMFYDLGRYDGIISRLIDLANRRA